MAQDTLKSLPEEAVARGVAAANLTIHAECQVQEKQLPALIEKLVNKLRKAEQVRKPANTRSVCRFRNALAEYHGTCQAKLDEAAAKVPAPPPEEEAEVTLSKIGPSELSEACVGFSRDMWSIFTARRRLSFVDLPDCSQQEGVSLAWGGTVAMLHVRSVYGIQMYPGKSRNPRHRLR